MTTHASLRRALLLATVLAAPALAQVCPPPAIHQRLDGPPLQTLFGFWVANAHDLDGDGVPDALVGAPADEGTAGAAYAFSGRDGRRLHRFAGAQVGQGFGRCVAGLGDVDGDGHGDVAIGAPLTDHGTRTRVGSVYVQSGRTGVLVRRLDGLATDDVFGRSVAAMGDVDGDGVPDMLVGASSASLPGRARTGYVALHSGRTGTLLRHHEGADDDDAFGFALDGVGDWNGDGVPDYAMGAVWASSATTAHTGSVFVHSGRDGTRLARFDGPSSGDYFGAAVAGAGDVDGDGIPDLVVGASHARPGGRPNAGSVFVHSGRDGRLLHRFDGATDRLQFGFSVDGAGDVNGDGFADLVVGAVSPPASGSGVHVFSGRDGALLLRLDAAAMHTVAGLGDADGDGFADVLAGFPAQSPLALEFAVVFGARTSRTYGSGLPGTLGIPALLLERGARLGGAVELRAGNSRGSATLAALVLGPGAVHVPLFGGVLLAEPVILLTVALPVTGGIVFTAPVPNDRALACASVFQQIVVLDPGAGEGLAFSPGLEVVIWP